MPHSEEDKFNTSFTLSMATTQELAHALFARWPNCIILGQKDDKDEDNGVIECRYQQGNNRMLQGMAFGAAIRIEQEISERATRNDDREGF